MTRRDYVLVAKVISRLPARPATNLLNSREEAREAFVTEFLKDKPTFNAEAFRKACGA